MCGSWVDGIDEGEVVRRLVAHSLEDVVVAVGYMAGGDRLAVGKEADSRIWVDALWGLHNPVVGVKMEELGWARRSMVFRQVFDMPFGRIDV